MRPDHALYHRGTVGGREKSPRACLSSFPRIQPPPPPPSAALESRRPLLVSAAENRPPVSATSLPTRGKWFELAGAAKPRGDGESRRCDGSRTEVVRAGLSSQAPLSRLPRI